MLLRHAWLAPLMQPPSIQEEEEDEEAESCLTSTPLSPSSEHRNAPSTNPDVDHEGHKDVGVGVSTGALTIDPEVGTWVLKAIEQRRLGRMGKSAKPALHAAPLDAVSPGKETVG
jgi:mitogen-activated protein kinase kinase